LPAPLSELLGRLQAVLLEFDEQIGALGKLIEDSSHFAEGKGMQGGQCDFFVSKQKSKSYRLRNQRKSL
jgi:hypothetical protein